MPVVTAEVVVPVSPDVAFAVSQTTGATRLHWDLTMVSRYVSFSPGSNVGMTMEDGPSCTDPVVLAAVDR